MQSESRPLLDRCVVSYAAWNCKTKLFICIQEHVLHMRAFDTYGANAGLVQRVCSGLKNNIKVLESEANAALR